MQHINKIIKGLLVVAVISFLGVQAVNAVVCYSPLIGGTGTCTAPTAGQLLVGQADGTYLPTATSTVLTDTLQTVTTRGATTTVVSEFTNGIWSALVRAVSSAGTLFESSNGTDVALFGAGGGANATFYDGVTVTDNLIVDTSTLYVNATLNNVGISTTTPSSRLTIVNTGTDNSIRVEDTTSDTTPTVLDANGNLGLGVETPAYNLDIRGASGLDGATPITTNIYSTNNGTWTDEAIPAQLLFGTADATGGAGTRGAIKLYADDTTGADNGLSFWTTSAGSAGLAERMRIAHDGRTAIGTSPLANATLSVSGNSMGFILTDNITQNTNKDVRMGSIHYDNVTNTLPTIALYQINSATNNSLYFGGGTSGGYASTNIRFYTGETTTTTTGTARMYIASDGGISMGTSINNGLVTIGGSRNMAGMTTSQAGRVLDQATLTVTDTDQSGTIANRNAVAFRTTTFASSNAVTLTESASVYISSAPTAGTNTTITNPYAFWVDAGRTRLDGGLRLSHRAITSTTTLDVTTDYMINVTSGTFTVNLPTAVGNTGTVFIIKNSGVGTVTVDADGTETIDGALTYPLSTQYQSVTIISNGSNWLII